MTGAVVWVLVTIAVGTAIAAVIGVCDDTLRRHYDAELRRGDARQCAA